MENTDIENKLWNTSSLITSTSYNENQNELYVEFINGGKYKFQEVTATEYSDFCAAESQGSFFNKNINKKKPYEVIEKAVYVKKEKATEDGDKESI